MSRQVVYEVTQPYHRTGTEVAYQPGEQFPLDADLPADLRVKEAIADVPDVPVKAAKPTGKTAAGPGGRA